MDTAFPPDDERLRLRAAVAGDVPMVAAIEAQSFSDAWPESAFRSLLKNAAVRFTVCERRGLVCGYTVVIGAAAEAELANIAVAPSARQQGFGDGLLAAAIERSAGDGVASIYLEVRESNVAARRLYESHGFAAAGRRRGYYRQPDEDALVLVWKAAAQAEPAPSGVSAPGG